MHRHRVAAEDLKGERVFLGRAEARHFTTVLRLRAGDEVELFDGDGAAATFRIDAADKSGATLARVTPFRRQPRPSPSLVLGACVSKGSRFDWTIEKAVELGAARILPILSRNCVVKFANATDAEEKRLRWEKIALDAARQCGTNFLPEILAPLPFDAALAELAGAALFAGALTPDAVPIRDAAQRFSAATPEGPDDGRAIAWLVGPEGDFSASEYDALRAAGANLVSLGPLVLRTETAAIFGLCFLGAALARPSVPSATEGISTP